jgi:hypothetical protein
MLELLIKIPLPAEVILIFELPSRSRVDPLDIQYEVGGT